MDPINVISGKVSVLDRDDIDTDQIMPKQFLKRVERTGFGEFLFHDWRQEEGWDLPPNPILVTGENFGCGSSREHAPWGLEDYGFKAIVAPSFADIFFSNSTKIGLLPVIADQSVCDALASAGEGEIDLPNRQIRWGGDHPGSASFELDDAIHHRLVHGLDDIAISLLSEQEIEAYEGSRERTGPMTTAL